MTSSSTPTGLPVPPEPTDTPAHKTGPTRRSLLTFMVAAPTLTLAVKYGADLLEPAVAKAGIPGPPGFAEVYDLSDFLNLAALPTANLLVLEITKDGKAVLELPRTEVGQGITTAIAMLVAEELDIGLADVRVPLAPARRELAFNQLTGGSNSVHSLYDPVRALAAEARGKMVGAAAARWGLPTSQLRTSDGQVLAPDGRSAGYGSLSEAAALMRAAGEPAATKPVAAHKVIGRPTNRIDARDLVTGKAKYALDLNVRGAKPTVIARSRDLNGTVASLDKSKALKMSGVRGIAEVPFGVAVMADTFGEAIAARDALRITWNRGPAAGLSDETIAEKLRAAQLPLVPAPPGVGVLDATFDFAMVPHAPLEVGGAIADVRGDKAEIWACAKSPIAAQEVIADALGLDRDSVVFHVMRGGGSFGRKLFFDAALEAAYASKALKHPVKLMWTRADDMQHGRVRPASNHAIRATYANGSVTSYEHRVACAEVDFRHGLGEALTAAGFDVFSTGVSQSVFFLTQKVIYDFGATSQLLQEVRLPIPTGSWRSIYSGAVAAANEVVTDELAKALGKDPVAFRLENLKRDRAKAALTQVAKTGKWGRKMPKGHAQGVAIWEEYKGVMACLAEIDATDRKNPRVTKVVVAVDVGRPINPRGVQAQMLGAITDGISTVLTAGLHLKDGAIQESSYSDYRYAKQRNSPPQVEVVVMPANGEPGGCGELGVPAAAGAIANAYARATGTKVRQFPVNF